ncbi:MAG: hypothetical protein HOH43_20200 [Candidatus Latescibacteria bacterium]|jgi:hypothetical protein|nr:hypothetical protein [Candidatus Latescibacterota bacterium]
MSMEAFKAWYMDLYWKFDNLFLVAAEFFGITYHEFVLISLCVVWPAITLGLSVAVIKLWSDQRRLRQASLVLVLITFAAPAWAGPSAENMDYSVVRPLKIFTKVSNGIRFDIVKPADTFLKNGDMADWYTDQVLIVRNVKSGQVLHSQTLKSDKVSFVIDERLSKDFIVIKEWSGGASCCLIVHAYRTRPSFKKLLEHDNNFFDRTDLIAGSDRLVLYKESVFFIYPSSHSQLKYTPAVFNLRRNRWE